jgi:beta-phosphoglucomutase-like phosphatase (HAD superfamily)
VVTGAAVVATGAVVRPYDLVIFDCDGVLVDSERIANREFAVLLREIGLDFTLPQMFETFVGNTMARCVEIITERLGHAPPADLLDRYHAMIRVALEREIEPVAGVIELLDGLDAAGIPYAVASNGEHSKMQITLGATGWRALRGVDSRPLMWRAPSPRPICFCTRRQR